MFDLIIVGGGPAGTAATIYAARKQLKTCLVIKEWGGQSTVSSDIQNWIGSPHISGNELAENFKKHAYEYKGDYLTFKEGFLVSKVEKKDGGFSVTLESGEILTSKTVLISTGSIRRKLGIPGSDTFEHKGVVYCASCDGPLFSGMDVVVVGGGNAGFESAAQLLAYCKSVTLLNRSETFRADEITIKKLSAHPNLRIIKNAIPTVVHGEKFVTGISYKDAATGEIKKIDCSGVFVEIGQIPATDLIKGLVDTTEGGQIKIDPRNQKTSLPGIWSAGDCTDVLYHQNNIAAGDAVRALEDIYLSIHAS